MTVTTHQPLPTQAGWAEQVGALTGRTLAHWRAEPAPFLINLFFPVLTVLMMGGLFGGAIAGSVGDYIPFVIAGVLTMTMLFGLESTLLAMTSDAESSITDRLRSMPLSAGAILAGRAVADLIASVLGLVVTSAAGFAFGWRWENGIAQALMAYVLLIWLRIALLWVGIYLGLKAKGPDSVTAVQFLVWPASFVSTIFLDPATMPRWLGVVAEWSPLSATANACRELFGNATITGTTWAAEHSLLLAIAWPAIICVVCAPLAIRAYRALGA